MSVAVRETFRARPSRGARIAARDARVIVVLALICVAGGIATLVFGTTAVPLSDVFAALTGGGDAVFTVRELRLPRAVLGLLAGAAFGVSGAVFQSLLRNPLASPDIIGISAGASAAAVFGIIVLGASSTLVSVLALAGALLTAVVIALLASGPGAATARMILVGIGVAAILKSLLTLLLARAGTWDLQSAMQWLAGSLGGATWESIWPLAVTCVVVIPVLLLGTRALSVLRLGDDAAMGLGLRPAPTRWGLMLLAVILLAAGTAAAGPIAFVAFLAGPVASRLHGGRAAPLISAALVGAAIVMWSDLVGQLAFAHRYPVGVITGAVGAPVLIALLVGAGRKIGKR